MTDTFSRNLKRFRLEKNMTQEQAADALGVSAQTVSRWECSTTLPDVMVLPKIARLYGVTVDDLYKETSVAYEHYASRLASVYEASHKPEDFLQADLEYRKILNTGAATMEDFRSYGILHQNMLLYCKEKALSLFDRALKMGLETDETTYWRVMRQKIYFNSQIGREEDSIAEHRKTVADNSGEVNNWICLTAALSGAGRHQEAAECVSKALTLFPDNAILHIYGGDVYKCLKKYDDAFTCWDKALALDPTLMDAIYSKGFCYEELGEYERAHEVWCEIVEKLKSRGYEIEATFPQQLAQICEEKMNTD